MKARRIEVGTSASAKYPVGHPKSIQLALVLFAALKVGYSSARPTNVFATSTPPLRGGSKASVVVAANAVPASWLVVKEEFYDDDDDDDNNLHSRPEESFPAVTESFTDDEDSVCRPPSIAADQMALALRWTAEVNRRLELGIITHQEVATTNKAGTPQQQLPLRTSSGGGVDHLRGGGGSTTFRIPSTKKAHAHHLYQLHQRNEGATMFHAKSPWSRPTRATGAARWGPDLEKFLLRLMDVLRDDKDDDDDGSTRTVVVDADLERTLAMIYLDRACSVESPRSVVHPLPFCTPRTVHRLALTAVLLAAGAVRGVSDLSGMYAAVEAAFGISAAQSRSMVEWMRAALGDAGIFVTPDELREWKRLWEARFPA